MVKIFAIDFPAGRPQCKIKIRAQLKVLVWKTISISNNTSHSSGLKYMVCGGSLVKAVFCFLSESF